MTNDIQPAALSRRSFLRRTAVVGGALVWTAPAVQTVTRAAYAQTSPTPGDQDISFVAMLITVDNVLYRLKFEPGTGFEFGPNFAIDGCMDQLHQHDPAVSDAPPPGVTAAFDPIAGTVTVDLGSGTLQDYVVKCGVPSDPDDQGCEDVGEGAQTTLTPATGTVVFHRCELGDEPPPGD